MKEYTYTNKSYLGVKEGIVPPAPQYLWLNSKDNRLYKFGDNGWEVTNNAPYIVEDFTVNDIIDIAKGVKTQLTISRVFLDAMYKSVPIMVKINTTDPVTVPLKVTSISNPNIYTVGTFEVTYNNIVYTVAIYYPDSITDIKAVDTNIRTYNSADWNATNPTGSGYIANRTHYLGSGASEQIGDRIILSYSTGSHYFDNYKLLYNGEFYDIPPMAQGDTLDISDYFRLQFLSYSEAKGTSTFTFTSMPISESLPSQTFEIYRDFDGHKTLDEFFLPDGAKPWKKVGATLHPIAGGYRFTSIANASINNKDNVIRDKVIYMVGVGPIAINSYSTIDMLEFKIIADGGSRQITFGPKVYWENGEIPQYSSEYTVIYSFLILNGVIYASAKGYKVVK